MERTEGGRFCRAVLRLLYRTFVAMLASGLSTLVLAVLHFRAVTVLALSGLVVVSGLLYLLRAVLHRLDHEYDDPEIRSLVKAEMRFARTWIGVGTLLGIVSAAVDEPLLVPLFGAGITWTLYLHGWVAGDVIVRREKRLGIAGGSAWLEDRPWVRRWLERSESGPLLIGARSIPCLVGRKRPVGEISIYLTCTLLMIACVSTAYAGLAIAEVVIAVEPDIGQHAGASPEPVDSAIDKAIAQPSDNDETATPPPPSYAELCPYLPDPLDVGAGLGELFRHDGAVYAGCGGPALQVAVSTWTAAGLCGGNLRSVGVVGEGREPVLLYGAPAQFAREAGREGTLLYAEAGKPPGGEVDVVATEQGTYFFVRSSPRLRQRNEGPRRCTEVEAVPDAFTRLPPPLTELWLEHLRERTEWLWPAAGSAPGTFSFSPYPGAEPVASAECASDLACHFESAAGRRTLEGVASASLAEFEPYYPSQEAG